MHRKHLQEIPDSNSNVNITFKWGWDLNKTSDLLSGMGVAVLEKEKVDSENIPQELLLTQAPPPKKQKVKAKEKDFVIARRPRQSKENSSGISWDMLPDELLLGIFSYLSLPDLVRVSGICKRWHRLSFDESLWQTLDLAGKHLLPGVIGQLLSIGVVAFRCPRSHVDAPLFKNLRPLRVQHMDLSNCIIDEAALQNIMSRCCRLQNLSLEGLRLSDAIARNLAQNSDLVRLNLSGCSGFSASALGALLSGCTRLDELNLSWCSDFTAEHIQVAVSSVTESVTQLNLSGYRQNLQRSDVTTLVGRCPNLVHLDLSDSVLLKTDCFQELHQLIYLQHLSLSRCYEIMPAALLELGDIPSLKTLQVFGIVTENSLPVLKEALPHLKINCSHFTTIARPTVGSKKNPDIWGIRCRLMLPNPSSR
ncbi:S-phase kinase-associated protein 2 [Phascolarctos cinereus]|uniref:S-phase kinase-associated protein 2 n=2 Tax=Phascolarctos cinereus TaxID=38626 RepID=A0A6P5L402_PHACI|nr:S-phase kinase-associated protein 2 isoform X1 [Phascolarctos cinereus]